jgi:hypothetical protein
MAGIRRMLVVVLGHMLRMMLLLGRRMHDTPVPATCMGSAMWRRSSSRSCHEKTCGAHRTCYNHEFHFVVVHITPCLSPLLRLLIS